MNQLILYKKCSTCKRAKAWLDERGVSYSERDIKEDRPSADELRRFSAASGLPLKKFFNTSGILYRQLGLKDRLADMSEDEMAELLSSDGMLVKRPILVSEKGVCAGFKPEEWLRLI